ncbi:hypothetical protein ART_1251 [Arthrobacter sp. PAMC 25486]|uniref:glycosyltransferase n=1 Tax=Arthrobacter sp. PAMC 25486 TaxID=1494608 RepID=UPI00053607E7|nr:glycosyltransferase [Arthrobacter sp. PAMC 25486]AIY00850.1 hypothetical protein ART_1251 [Arthrobacter sp. PAMC 25486]
MRLWKKPRTSHPTLPAGQHYAVTWAISSQFGGMTNVLFQRSQAISRLGRHPIDILTFDYNEAYPSIRKNLERDGYLVKGLKILNMWEQFADSNRIPNLPSPTVLNADAFTPLDDSYPIKRSSATADGRTRRMRVDAETGKPLQTDYYRSNGTLYVSDRLDGLSAEGNPTRSIYFCDMNGIPIRRWNTTAQMYHAWLDAVSGRQQAYYIVDSKFSAKFMSSYRRPSAVIMHLVHGSHLAKAIDGPQSRLSSGRIGSLAKLDQYDALVFLTQEQCDDALERFQGADNFCVIPNSRPSVDANSIDFSRDPNSVVLVARLVGGKRIDHAIRAVVQARSESGLQLTLDIYGEGDDHDRLHKLVAELGAEQFVRLRGHTESIDSVFARTSMSLMTSSAEGFGLVLVESLAHGCIPITYDIKYGPSFIVTDGVDGFLIKDGDVEALAKSIIDTRNLSAQEAGTLRLNGITGVSRFTDEAIYELWVDEMRAAADRKALPSPSLSLSIVDSGVIFRSGGDTVLYAEADHISNVDSPISHFAVLINRNDGSWHRVPVSKIEERSTTTYMEFSFSTAIISNIEGEIMDAFVESRSLNTRIQTRVPFESVSGRLQVYSTKYGNLSFR